MLSPIFSVVFLLPIFSLVFLFHVLVADVLYRDLVALFSLVLFQNVYFDNSIPAQKC